MSRHPDADTPRRGDFAFGICMVCGERYRTWERYAWHAKHCTGPITMPPRSVA